MPTRSSLLSVVVNSRTRALLLAPVLAVFGNALAQTAPTSQDSANDPNTSFSARLLNLLPAGYGERFGSLQAYADAINGYGVRYFPLPFKADARLTYISHPLYKEYGVSVRYDDTTYAAGRYQNDAAGVTQGIAHLEITHNPYTGLQYGALYQDSGASSRFTAGYAVTAGPLRYYSELGYAFQGKTDTPYAHFEVSGGKSVTDGPFTYGVAATVRSYLFPETSQESVDLSASVTVRPTDYLNFTVSQFERFFVGESPIPDLAVGRYTRTNIDVVLLPKVKVGPFSLRSTEYHRQTSLLRTETEVNTIASTFRTELASAFVVDLTPHYDFVASESGVRGDLFFRTDALPVLVGPSFDYIWSPTSSRWVISLRAGVK